MAAIDRTATTPVGTGVVPRTVEAVRVREITHNAPGLPFTFGLIPSYVHGALDYLVGIGAIVAPGVLGFGRGTPAALVMQIQGIVVLVYSLFTNYEWGVVRRLPFQTHLLLDFVGGMLMASSPWVLGFRRRGRDHLALGLLELGITLLSRRRAWTR